MNICLQKIYVDKSIDEISLVRNVQDNDLNSSNLTNINSINLNTQAVDDYQVQTKAYVDQFHQENEQSRRNLGIDFNDDWNDLVKNNQDNDLNDDKLIIVNSSTINQDAILDYQVSAKKYLDDSIGEGYVRRFNKTLENYLKESAGNDTYIFNKYNKIQITATIIIHPNTGKALLQPWNIICNDKNNNSQTGNFIKSTKTSSPTSRSGETVLPLSVTLLCA